MQLSLAEARRIALAAQGFDRPRPRRAGARDIAAAIRRLALVQLDYVNVLVPSHSLVLFSRRGAYDRALCDEVASRSGHCLEAWPYEASIVPVEPWPLLRYRRAARRPRPWGFQALPARNP